MDTRPIGVFDSGLGGLTGLGALRRLLPGEDFVFFGDTARVPYGARDKETLVRFSLQDAALLRSLDVKAILISCGTVSANAIEEVRQANDLPVYGVIGPAVERAAAMTRNGKVGVIATEASIRSGAYEANLAALTPHVQVVPKACPKFVELVESGRFRPDDPLVKAAAEEYLPPVRDAGVDTLILGCTHYPLLAEVISQVMGPDVALIDVGAAAAAQMAAELGERGLLNGKSSGGACRYCVSGDPERFAGLAALFLREEGPITAEQIDIERY